MKTIASLTLCFLCFIWKVDAQLGPKYTPMICIDESHVEVKVMQKQSGFRTPPKLVQFRSQSVLSHEYTTTVVDYIEGLTNTVYNEYYECHGQQGGDFVNPGSCTCTNGYGEYVTYPAVRSFYNWDVVTNMEVNLDSYITYADITQFVGHRKLKLSNGTYQDVSGSVSYSIVNPDPEYAFIMKFQLSVGDSDPMFWNVDIQPEETKTFKMDLAGARLATGWKKLMYCDVLGWQIAKSWRP